MRQQSVHVETLSRGGLGCKGTSGLCSRSAQPRGWSSSRPATSKGRNEGGGLQNCRLTVPVSARRDCISTPGGSALYSRPCVSRRAKTPSCNASSSLLPTSPKQNDGLYRFCCNVCASDLPHGCVRYQTASVRTEVLTLIWC